MLGDAVGEGRACALKCDVSSEEQVRAAVEAATVRFGGLTVLCSVAGGSSPRDGKVTEASIEEFRRVIGVDLFGTFLVCRFGIPELVKAGGGAVVNFSSVAALMALLDRDCYTAAKGGVSALTRSMAYNFGPAGIRVNAIAPGATMAPRIQALQTGEHVQQAQSRQVLGNVYPVDIAELAVFLASAEASHLTGQIIPVDSGLTIS
ncbi:SDR family oxidoreductase [Amycolatopsis sp. NPDC049253]|uniref:SDR family NAD(P)-dependent oxidoreductase n=1 Tax=Amycolatopsis sp. NPDC049253 TaxID=3155274 RepID=UPI003418179B